MKKHIAARLAALGVGLVPMVSMAAVDAGVTTAMSDLKTDVGVVALAAFTVTLVILGYKKFNRAAA